MARFITKTVCMALITVLCVGNVFAQGETYNIITLANPTPAGVIVGGGTYDYGETATVTAIPAGECWKFIDWTENGIEVSTDAEYSFIVTADRVLIANFEFGRQGYEITVLANPPEGGTVTGGGSFPACGGVATVTAIPGDCYEFVNWTEDGVPVSMDPYYTFTVTENRTLVANFAPKRDGCEVIVLANPPQGGTVTGDGTYSCGDEATVTAIPVECWKFIYWTENDIEVSTDADYTFIVTKDRVLVANFALTAYEIIVLADPPEGGVVTGGGAYDCGGSVLVTATPAEGYIFVNWTEDGMLVSDDAFYAFSVNRNRTLVANFTGTTAIGEVETSGITIYPNPTSGLFTICDIRCATSDNLTSDNLTSDNLTSDIGQSEIEIFDIMGRTVQSEIGKSEIGNRTFDLSNVPSGVYFVRIQTENGVVTKKIILSER